MVVLFLVEKATILNNLLHKRKFMYYDLGKLL